MLNKAKLLYVINKLFRKKFKQKTTKQPLKKGFQKRKIIFRKGFQNINRTNLSYLLLIIYTYII